MNYWPLTLLLCAGCYSTTLSDAERAKVTKAAEQAGTGYGANHIGQLLTDTVGMRPVWITPTYIFYQRPADSLAYGLVPLLDGVTYTVSQGRLTTIKFTTLDKADGYKLYACIAQLYGPLKEVNSNFLTGQRGQVLAQLVCYADGGAAVVLISADSTNRLGD
jgi:hypothetical protein